MSEFLFLKLKSVVFKQYRKFENATMKFDYKKTMKSPFNGSQQKIDSLPHTSNFIDQNK